MLVTLIIKLVFPNNYKTWREKILHHLGFLDIDYAIRKEELPAPTSTNRFY